MKQTIRIGIGATSNEVAVGMSNKAKRTLKDVGLYKKGFEHADALNNLMASNLDNLAQQEYVVRVLERNDFVKVVPSCQATKSFFESMASDMPRKRQSEATNGVEQFFTVFKPMVRQFGELVVFYTINLGYELVLSYFVGSRYANNANEYVNMVFTRLRNGEGLKGIFAFSNELVATYTDDVAVLADSEHFLKYNLKDEERKYLNNVKNGSNHKIMAFEEVLLSSKYLKPIKDVLDSNDSVFVDAINVNNLLKEELAYLNAKVDELDDFDELNDVKFAIDFIESLVYGERNDYKKKERKNGIILNGDVDKLKTKNNVLGVCGGRRISVKDAKTKFGKFLDENDKYDALLCVGSNGFDTVAIGEALKRDIDVFIISPRLTSMAKTDANLRIKNGMSNANIYFINKSNDKVRYNECNDIVALYSKHVVYYGLKDKSNTSSCLYACKRHKTSIERL